MMTALFLVGMYFVVKRLKGLWAMTTADPAQLMHWVGLGRRLLGR
jgi:hypothetical protein